MEITKFRLMVASPLYQVSHMYHLKIVVELDRHW